MSTFSASRSHRVKSRAGADRPHRWVLSTLVLALLGSGLLASHYSRALADDPGVTQITQAPPLTWGFKLSWRNYAPLTETGNGAEPAGSGSNNIKWIFKSGTYDAATQTTHIKYGGTARWQKYRASQLGYPKPPGYPGPEVDPYLLDVKLSDPEITISRDSSVLTAVAVSRDLDTWEVTDYGRVPIVSLGVLGVTPTVAAGTTQWAGIAATVTAQGRTAFDDNYRVGQVVDDVAFSYTGPGGAPDFTEHWDTPGAAILKLVQNTQFASSTQGFSVEPLWIDRKNLIVHSSYPVTVGGVSSRRLEAFSLKEMHTIGEPLVLPMAQFPQVGRVAAYDSNQSRLLYRQAASELGITRWLEFNLDTEGYEMGTVADPQLADPSFIGTNSRLRMAWDPTRNRGYRIERVVPDGVAADDYDNHEWQLITYKEGGGGIWVKKTLELPGFGSGLNQDGYAQETLISAPTYATASDGSLIALSIPKGSTDPSHPAPETIPGAYRLVVDDEAGTVEVEPLAEVANSLGAAGVFNFVQTAANGHVLLIKQSGPVVHCQIEPDGPTHCDDPVSIAEHVETTANVENRFAIDPADGTVWYGGIVSQKLAAIKGGEFLGGQFFKERNPRGGPVLVGDDHTVYAQTNDGSAAVTGGSKSWGYGKFIRLGFVPAITAQPQTAAVTLGTGEVSEQVTFGSVATGDPAPSRQWQVKTPSAPVFSDIDGESGQTLTVDATAAGNGTRYRAIYENAAGRVASDVATLAVSYAPLFLTNAADVSVHEGEDAEISVLPEGNPEPAVSWQRRVGGFWQNIAPDDDNFAIEGSSLTVRETNTEQSGALFRAKLTNSVATVFSRTAKLTVTPSTTIPPGGIDLEGVSLDWKGNPELQKAQPFGGGSYFSAGRSDGDEASYRAIAGNAVAYQVSAGGTETIASWPARAAHVTNGGGQLVRLYGGEGRVEEGGSVTIEWNGAFSVNFYGGLVPFTLTDPELMVDEDGDGSLVADLSGYASSQSNPTDRSPLAPVADVTVATFSGVEIEPSGELTVTPDYAGVEVTVPDGTVEQNRTVAGWGAWPQSFVDFHVKSGSAPYWYSSGGGADPYKAPSPLVLDFEGGAAPAEPTPAAPGTTVTPRPQAPAEPASIAVSKRVQSVGAGGLVRLATVSCPAAGSCQLDTPKRVAVWIGGKRYWAKVIAPKYVSAGDSAEVTLKLTRAARRALAGGAVTVKALIVVGSEAGVTGQMAKVRVRGPGH